jgi:hypothetical protein
MPHEQSNTSVLSKAVLLSLVAHVLVLMPWRYGAPLSVGGFYREDARPQPRLQVSLQATTLKQTQNETSSLSVLPVPEALPEEILPAAPISPLTHEPATVPAGVPLDLLYYYTVAELDQRPVMKHRPRLEEAPGGANLMASGTATLEILIEKNGRVNAVNIVRTDLPASYINSIENAFIALRYNPGIRREINVRSRLYVEVEYRHGQLSSMDNIQYTAVPPVPMGNAKALHQRKANPPLRD